MAGEDRKKPILAEPAWLIFTAGACLLFTGLHVLVGLPALHAALACAIVLVGAYGLWSRLDRVECRDLSRELADTREALAEARATLARRGDPGALLARLPEPLLLIGPEGRIEFANLAAVDLFARDLAGEIMESAIRDPELIGSVERVLGGSEPETLEFNLPGKVQRSFATHITSFSGVAEGPRSALILLHDLTAARSVERLRADFVANASHELRTPLASLSGFIETLQGPARDDDKAREKFLKVMADQAARMGRLIEDLLVLSRIELAEHSPPREQLDIEEIVRTVAGSLQQAAEAKQMPIEILAEPVPRITGDQDELWRVFQNLIDNALKYGNAKSPVTVAISKIVPGTAEARAIGRQGVKVAVKNEGEGVEPEHIPRLTERFYRVDTARSRLLGGTGLGLAIVKHITNRHRGQLRIESTPGKDVTVTCLFPEAGS